jgi:hypothetical protein
MNVLNFRNRPNSWKRVRFHNVGFPFIGFLVVFYSDEDEEADKSEEVLQFDELDDMGRLPVKEPVSTENLPDSSSTESRTGRGKVAFLRL